MGAVSAAGKLKLGSPDSVWPTSTWSPGITEASASVVGKEKSCPLASDGTASIAPLDGAGSSEVPGEGKRKFPPT